MLKCSSVEKCLTHLKMLIQKFLLLKEYTLQYICTVFYSVPILSLNLNEVKILDTSKKVLIALL